METSLNGQTYEPSLSYTNLGAGHTHLIITDQQGCTLEEQLVIDEPGDWSVNWEVILRLPMVVN